MNKKITVLTKTEYNEWIELFKETGTKYRVTNESDYSGFQVKLEWAE